MDYKLWCPIPDSNRDDLLGREIFFTTLYY